MLVFVTWDSDIIPSTVAEPALYPSGKELITFGEVTGDSRAEYFARYTSGSLGKVKNLYMKWARLGNAMSPECQQLNRLFSQCVDGNHIRIPENLQIFKKLEDPPEPKSSIAPFILDSLHEACMRQIQRTATLKPEMQDDVSIVDLLLTRDKMAISEFELLGLLVRWCDRHSVDIMTYTHAVDFSALTDEQQVWFLARLPPSSTTPSLVRNGLLQSDIISPQESRRFGLAHPHLRWKPVFRSNVDRMSRFLPVVCRSLESFHKKLIVLHINERLSIAVYIPHKIIRASEVTVDNAVRVMVFPHTQGPQSANYRVMPTKINYRLYCDEQMFQLYQQKKGNTWIFLRSPKGDDALYRALPSVGDKRRVRDRTVQQQINFDCKASVALDKIGQDIQKHIGRVQGEGVLGGVSASMIVEASYANRRKEVYVISNRDVAAMRVLDQWLHYVDTQEVLPLYEILESDYTTSKLAMLDWDRYSEIVRSICRDNDLSSLRQLSSIAQLQEILDLLKEHDEKRRLRDVFSQALLLAEDPTSALYSGSVVSTLLRYLQDTAYLTSTLIQSRSWSRNKAAMEHELIDSAPAIAKRLILLCNELSGFVIQPLSILLNELKMLSTDSLVDLVELIALTVRSPELSLDLLLGVLEPEMSRLLVGRPLFTQQLTSTLFGIALDHIDEAAASSKPQPESIRLTVDDYKDGHTIVKSILRVDSSMTISLKTGDHVRFTVTTVPQNDPFAKPFSMDALVLSVEPGTATFRCLHEPPPYLARCAWQIVLCGSFVNSKTMFDSARTFYIEREACCDIYASVLGLPDVDQIELENVKLRAVRDPSLNASQNGALTAAMGHSLTLIWGPPGTGKTHTIIVILSQLLEQLPQSRILVTAPTHNAVDNILGRFVNTKSAQEAGTTAVRVSTQVSQVMGSIPLLADALTQQTSALESIARSPAIYLRRDARPRPYGQLTRTPQSSEASQGGPFGIHHMYWREPWAIAR